LQLALRAFRRNIKRHQRAEARAVHMRVAAELALSDLSETGTPS
jgi:hypothetical protein